MDIKLTRQRTVLKAKVTSLENFVKDFKESEDADVVIGVKLKSISTLQANVDTLRCSLYELPETTDITEFDEQLLVLENRLEKVEVRLKLLQNSFNCEDISNDFKNEKETICVKLPEIPLPEFSGKYEEWNVFKSQFMNLISNNEKLTDVQKLYYLRAALKGEAKKLETADDTYMSLFQALEVRFDNKRLVVDTHIQAILHCGKIQYESAKELRNLLDNVNRNLRALKALEFERSNLSDVMLVNIILQKLDRESIKQFELTLATTEVPKLDDFLSFLEKRSIVLESVNCNMSVKPVHKSVQKNRNLMFHAKQNMKSCFLCKGAHPLYKCIKFNDMNVSQRYDVVRKNSLCMNCLSSHHTASQCSSRFTCYVCNKKHNSLLHRGGNSTPPPHGTIEVLPDETPSRAPAHPPEKGDEKPQALHSFSHIVNNHSSPLLSTVFVYIYDSNGKAVRVRAILDNGSQVHLMTTSCADTLGFKKEKVFSPVSGINGSKHTIKKKTTGIIANAEGNFRRQLDFLVVPKITDHSPSAPLDLSNFEFPEDVKLADPQFFNPGKIQLLIGAEIFFDILKSGKLRLNDRVLLQNSVFGYIVSGNIPQAQSQQYCYLSTEFNKLDESVRKFWEIESIEQCYVKNEDEEICEKHFLETHRRDESGRYIVQMPMKENPKCLGQSRNSSERKLNALWQRLAKQPELSSLYQTFMDEYERLGHMELVDEVQEPDVTYYMPHHAIYRPEKSTTKLRVVFNASAPSSNGTSLNLLQRNGGVVQDDLFSILIRFRKHRYAFISDIEKMYRMVQIDSCQRDLQRILWKSSIDAPVKIYRLCTVTYGTTNAPFLATRTLKQLVCDEEKNYPLAASVAHTDFYVDDLLSGADDISTAMEIQMQLMAMLQSGGMKLRKWSSNVKQLLQQVPYEDLEYHFDSREDSCVKTLGLLWNPEGDTLGFTVSPCMTSSEPTERSVLSEISRLFDPLGLLGPVVLKAKVFLQKLWMLKIDWDQQIPHKMCMEWKTFSASLYDVGKLQVNRYVQIEDAVCLELHGFSDASNDAYGAAIYLRSINVSGDIKVSLLCSKSRVAPLKTVTIPRLELCAAELLSHLINKVLRSLRLDVKEVYLWSDSTIALCWIQTSPHMLKTFVANRVSRIQELTKDYQWLHVKSEENPADLVSRGLNPNQITDCTLWWSGPQFLQQDISPSRNLSSPADREYHQEFKETQKTVLNVTNDSMFLQNLLNRTNSYVKLIRILSFVFRFVHNVKNPTNQQRGFLTSKELKAAELYLVKQVQVREFSEEISSLKSKRQVSSKSKLRSLNPFLDENSVLRVGGRLIHSSLDYNRKHPILLPKSHQLTQMIVEYFHRVNLHASPQALLYAVRQQFWPIDGRNLVRKIVNKCVVCFKQNPTVSGQIMGNLPSERVTKTSAFNVSGIDFCGPFHVKMSGQRRGAVHKIYIAIFICFVTKAIHLEIVSDLTSDAFIACLKRFFARRGKSSVIFSDNATNFVGAQREIKRLHQMVAKPDEVIGKMLSSEGIEWKFIPPKSPNFGGLWEAGVKSFKYYLRRTTGNANLTLEEFLTVVAQIEGILNSRPISPLSSDANDLEALTPGHFLIGRPLSTIPEPDLLDTRHNRLSRWQMTTRFVQAIWKRWHNDYLSNLQQRTKWILQKDNLKENDLVLIKEDNLPPAKWLMGRVASVIRGSDGKVRVAIIKTSVGHLKRSISKICVLPVS